MFFLLNLKKSFSVVLEPVLELALVDQTGLEFTESSASRVLVKLHFNAKLYVLLCFFPLITKHPCSLFCSSPLGVRKTLSRAVVAHAFNSSTQEAETGGSLCVLGHPSLHSEFQDRFQSYRETVS